MASDLQPFSPRNLAVGATLTPSDRATGEAVVTGTDGLRPAHAAGTAPSRVGAPDVPVDAPIYPSEQPVLPSAGHGLLRTRLFLLDLATVGVCWVGLGFVLVKAPSIAGRLAPGLVATVITLVSMRSVGLYRARVCSRRVDEIGRLVLSSLWGGAGFVLVTYEMMSMGPEVLACVGANILVLTVCRSQYGRWLRAQRARGRYLRSVVLVGSNEDAALLETMLRSEPELGYVVTGVISDSADTPNWDTLPTSRSVNGIPLLAAATGANGVLIVPYALSSATTQRAIAVATGANLHVQVWPGWCGGASRRLRHVPLSGEPFFYVEPPVSSRWQPAVKRAMDVIGACAGLVLVAPIIGVAALLIKLEDRGPVLHRGERVGRHGRTFLQFKLRSMTPGDGEVPPELAALNERVDGPLFKATHDPRVTKVGRVLRASSIDELPQLLNVLQGTMSLVGPRPALPSEAVQFDEELQRRHSVRPGMTGLWQVEARHNPSFNAYRRLDLRYVDNWSLGLDLTILANTVPSVASQAVSAFRNARRR